MKTFKKIVALLLAVIMLFTVTACAENKPAGSDAPGTTEDISDDNIFDDEPVWNDDTSSNEQSSTTTQPSTQKKEENKKPSQSQSTTSTTATTTVKNEEPEKPQKISILKAEYTYKSVKQIVYYPSNMNSSGKAYPAVVWANGTMCPPSMYDGLLREIAEGGYIVIANEETMAADGTAQSSSVDFIIEQNGNSESIFYKKIKTAKIGAAGHSQGGRSSVNAAAADNRIDCVLSLAGSNFDYEAELLSTPTFFIAGGSDMVVDAGMWIEPAYEICKGPAVYASLKGAIHTRCCTNPSDYSGYAVKWFDTWLKNDANALNTFKDGGALSKDSKWTDFAYKGF